jgi:hypothetical protein
MFCSFAGDPLILRLFGRTRCGGLESALWREYASRFDALPGARQIIVFEVDSVQTACGFGVPLMTFEAQRSTLTDTWAGMGEDGVVEYQRSENRVSIDGLPTGLGEA